MSVPIDITNFRNITVSGRIGTGATTLAKKLAEELGWEMLEGGQIMRRIQREIGANVSETNKRPDHFDLEYEKMVKKILREEKHRIVQSHLAGFDAQGIGKVLKILLVCEDENGKDKEDVRIDRLVNRDRISVEEAKQEVVEREEKNLEKWRRLYADGDGKWVYWDKGYYDLTINTYSHSPEQTLKITLEALKVQ